MSAIRPWRYPILVQAGHPRVVSKRHEASPGRGGRRLDGYTLLGGLLYQTPLAGHAKSLAAGLGVRDNDQFVWMLAWSEHAIAKGWT